MCIAQTWLITITRTLGMNGWTRAPDSFFKRLYRETHLEADLHFFPEDLIFEIDVSTALTARRAENVGGTNIAILSLCYIYGGHTDVIRDIIPPLFS